MGIAVGIVFLSLLVPEILTLDALFGSGTRKNNRDARDKFTYTPMRVFCDACIISRRGFVAFATTILLTVPSTTSFCIGTVPFLQIVRVPHDVAAKT